MKFVQVADVHFDVPFTTISDRADLGEMRRIEQRKAFKKMINFIKENNVEYLFICGDLYEHEYIRKSTIEFINNEFKEIPDTQIFIAPGNHDPMTRDSYYKNYNWTDNVKIFTSHVDNVDLGECEVWGYGFDSFELKSNEIDNLDLNHDKFNILLTHGDLYTDSIYNHISNAKAFDYVAIGHIHKRDDFYSGSLISLGFDETGEHGFIYGEVENKKLIRKFIKADDRELIVDELDISNINSEEELVEKLNSVECGDNLYEIKLIGNRNVNTDINLKLIQENIIKIKDKTSFKLDIEQKKDEKTLTGFFVKNLKKMLENGDINEEQYQKILELGNRVLNK